MSPVALIRSALALCLLQGCKEHVPPRESQQHVPAADSVVSADVRDASTDSMTDSPHVSRDDARDASLPSYRPLEHAVPGAITPKTVEKFLGQLEQHQVPFVHIDTIGLSSQKKPIRRVRMGDSPYEGKPHFLLTGAHHANELSSIELALDAIEFVLRHAHTQQVSRWLNSIVLDVVPVLNVDGLEAYTNSNGRVGRKNQHGFYPKKLKRDEEIGVDINRNYPFHFHRLNERGSSSHLLAPTYRGPSASSEPETKAIMAIAENAHYVASVSFHASACKILVPYTTNEARSPEPSMSWDLAELMARTMPWTNGKSDFL